MDLKPQNLPEIARRIADIREVIIANIVLLGQVPAPTFQESRRTAAFCERLNESQIDECTTDGYNNPIGIIRGTSPSKPPIFLVAHLDTFFDREIVYNFTVGKTYIEGPGLLDNSVGVGVLASIPQILRFLDLHFESDIVLAGVIQSLGHGNLRGIRHLLKTWVTPIRGAISIEGVELGRLNYFSDGMLRCEIRCSVNPVAGFTEKHQPNAILVLNEMINQIMELGVPQRPRSQIIIGKISGGVTHGRMAHHANMGMEIHSNAMKVVKSLYQKIKDIVDGFNQEYDVSLKLKIISNLHAARLKFNHPLVKSAVAVMQQLKLKPVSEASESELSIMLARGIPAVTLGITHGENKYEENARVKIQPMFKGIAQVLGVMAAIDSGVCDG